jgi:hypothetical protein
MDYALRQSDSRRALRRKSISRRFISFQNLPTLGVFLASKLIYKPLNKSAKPLAKQTFLQRLSQSSRHIRLARTAQHRFRSSGRADGVLYFKIEVEFENWWKEIGAETNVEIIWHNQNSWCGFGYRRKCSSTLTRL